MLQVGKPASAFDLFDVDLEMVSLAGFRGQHHVVLYFYPRDDTPGCTIEAIDFSDLQDEFEKLGAVVLGVSMDDCISHGSFRALQKRGTKTFGWASERKNQPTKYLSAQSGMRAWSPVRKPSAAPMQWIAGR